MTNIFICLDICGCFQSKYNQTFIWDFFLLMNIVGYSFGMLDSNKYIQIKSSTKYLMLLTKKSGNLTFQRLIFKKKMLCPPPLFHLHYQFAIIFCQYFSCEHLYIHSWIYYMDKYIQIFICENVDNWIYSDPAFVSNW